jgi:hypothetical protein
MEPCIANIFLSKTNEMQRYTMFFIVVSALHVSNGFSAHHQELKAVCAASLAWLSQNGVPTQPGWREQHTCLTSTDVAYTVFELLMMSRKTVQNM